MNAVSAIPMTTSLLQPYTPSGEINAQVSDDVKNLDLQSHLQA